MNPFALGLATATLAALVANLPLTAATLPARQPPPAQRAAGLATPRDTAASWPTTPATVLRPFEPHEAFGPGHRGVDLAAVPGQEVRSALIGRVSFAGEVAGRPIVVIEHEGDLRTTYLPLAATVAVGTRVDAGQPIGTLAVGAHCPVSSCLHWGARLGNEYVDPLTLLGREVVLLPLDGDTTSAAYGSLRLSEP